MWNIINAMCIATKKLITGWWWMILRFTKQNLNATPPAFVQIWTFQLLLAFGQIWSCVILFKVFVCVYSCCCSTFGQHLGVTPVWVLAKSGCLSPKSTTTPSSSNHLWVVAYHIVSFKSRLGMLRKTKTAILFENVSQTVLAQTEFKNKFTSCFREKYHSGPNICILLKLDQLLIVHRKIKHWSIFVSFVSLFQNTCWDYTWVIQFKWSLVIHISSM